MKLKHKLIPLASAAAVCATVAPIALTSCGSGYEDMLSIHIPGYDKIKQEINKDTKLPKYIMSQVDESKLGTAVKYTGATEAWTELMQEHPDYFAADYYWTISNAVNVINTSKSIVTPAGGIEVQEGKIEEADPNTGIVELEEATPDSPVERLEANNIKLSANEEVLAEYNKTYTRDSEKISDFSITTQKFTVTTPTNGEISWDIPTISFRLDYNRTVETSIRSQDGRKADYVTTYKGYRIYKDVPVVVTQMECSFLNGVYTFNIKPLMWWGTDAFKNEVEKFAPGVTLKTVSPKEWTITRSFTETRNGTVTDASGTNALNWTADDEMTIDPSMVKQLEADKSLEDVKIEFTYGLSTSWYLFSVEYASNAKLASIWNFEPNRKRSK